MTTLNYTDGLTSNMASRVELLPVENRAGFLERAFVVTAILFSTGAFGSLWFTAEQVADPRQGADFLQLFWAVVYAYSLFALWRYYPQSFRRLWKEKWILALVGLTLCSTAWSQVPMTTLRHGIGIAAGFLFSLYVVERFSFFEQLKILAWVFALAALFSFVFGAFGWGTAVFDVPGTWIGIYSQKNVLGRSMAMGAIVFSLLSEHLGSGRWLTRIGILACLILIVLASSGTAMVAIVVLFYAKHLIGRLVRGRRIRLEICLVILIACIGIPLLASNFEKITESLARDPTLTGRTAVWAISLTMAMSKPWLGYGYGGFWLGGEGPSLEVWRTLNIAMPNAHNGLIDMILDLGLIGALVALLGYASYLRKAFRVLAAEKSWENAWPLLFLIALLLLNVTESDFMSPNFFYWFIYLSVGLQVSRRMSALTAGAEQKEQMGGSSS